MKLLDNFCELIDIETNKYTVKFFADHVIYQSHFCNNPITPGACTIQIARELFELKVGKKLIFKHIKSIKFMHPINPLEFPSVTFHFLNISTTEEEYQTSVLVSHLDKEFVKMTVKMQAI